MERTFSASGHTTWMAACSLARYTIGPFSATMSARSFKRSFRAKSPSSEPTMMEKGPFTSALAYTVRSAVSKAARSGSMASISRQEGAAMMWAAICWDRPWRRARRSNR